MKRRITWLGRGGIVALGVGAVISTATVANADTTAASTPLLRFTRSATDLSPAVRLAATAGIDPAGVYLDGEGHVNVAVTSQAAADKVRKGGGIPRLVVHSVADLKQKEATLEDSLKVAGTSWYVDPQSDQVVVETDDTVAGAKLAKVQAEVAKLGPAARLAKTSGNLRLEMSGGDTAVGINGGSAVRCSDGFNVQANGGGPKYMLTAGHCTNAAHEWFTEKTQQHFATTVATNYAGVAGQDFGLAEYDLNTSVVHNGDVNLYNGSHQDIMQTGTAFTGMYVERTGSSSGFHDGHVQATDVTVTIDPNNPHTFHHMIQTNLCAVPGDSGGPLFAGSTAYGITSSGNGTVDSNGNPFCPGFFAVSYYQPVQDALDTYHVHVY